MHAGGPGAWEVERAARAESPSRPKAARVCLLWCPARHPAASLRRLGQYCRPLLQVLSGPGLRLILSFWGVGP